MTVDHAPDENPDIDPDAEELAKHHRDALKEVLTALTQVYSVDNERTAVTFGSRSMAMADGSGVMVNPYFPDEVDPDVEGPNILRVITDLLAHEQAHVNWSKLTGKQEFSDMYPGWGKIPGHICNILEDEYIDAERMRNWYGMRQKRAFRVWLQMQTDEWTPPVDEVCEDAGLAPALVTALHQLAIASYVKGIDDAPWQVIEFCERVEPVINRVRQTRDEKEREKLFHVVMHLVMEYADTPGHDDGLEETVEAATSGEAAKAPAGSISDEPDMTETAKKSVEDTKEDLVPPSSAVAGGGGGTGGESSTPTCPECGGDDVGTDTLVRSGRIAALVNAPFSEEDEWVHAVQFIDTADLFGFRVELDDAPPKRSLEESGARVERVSASVAEILEPKKWYSDEEEIEFNVCDSCGHEWLDTVVGTIGVSP